MSVLTEFLREQKLSSCWVAGMGGLQNATLGYYNQAEKQYSWQEYQGNLELTNLTGNVAQSGQGLALHLHATVSDETLRCVGGHLKSAIVGATVELYITELAQAALRRRTDNETGLNLLTI